MSWGSISSRFLAVCVTVFLATEQALASIAMGGWVTSRQSGGGGGGGGNGSAPEIDGPAGLAAIAVLVSVGMIAYNRYRKK